MFYCYICFIYLKKNKNETYAHKHTKKQTNIIILVSPYANGGHFNSSAVTVSPAELQTYQIRSGNSAHLPTGAMMGNSAGPGEEATKKRELRLQKNRYVFSIYYIKNFIFFLT